MSDFLNKLYQNCIKQNIPVISKNTQQYLKIILDKYKPQNCLEIGSAVAFSTIFFSKQIIKWNATITGFEISLPSYKQALNNIAQAGSNNIKLYNLNFNKTPLDKILIPNLDFVFIDATKKEYLIYFKLIQKFLNKNCIIIFDDVIKFNSKMKELYTFFQKNQLKYKIHQLDHDDGVMEMVHNPDNYHRF